MIYTRTGDKGCTALIGGERISKSHLRLECYGTLDELNAFTGRLKCLCKVSFLDKVQKTLFDIGAILATPDGKKWNNMPSINETHIKELENEIDKISSTLEPLKSFNVPGENEVNAEAHVCRTVCRRAERILCNAKENGITINDFVMIYINRLSDYFFVLARNVKTL
ncbi:MAG: cob(I)yrinic acid a,c-diamide adenosyltransferase [Fibromonadaceae bacterium]|jgi:cob(I)alamin adenosyltransferase|nr:cob(I)yrinic acid a,c-diamide adenosyltransferase [Fibromonadaceae bacterium]